MKILELKIIVIENHDLKIIQAFLNTVIDKLAFFQKIAITEEKIYFLHSHCMEKQFFCIIPNFDIHTERKSNPGRLNIYKLEC